MSFLISVISFAIFWPGGKKRKTYASEHRVRQSLWKGKLDHLEFCILYNTHSWWTFESHTSITKGVFRYLQSAQSFFGPGCGLGHSDWSARFTRPTLLYSHFQACNSPWTWSISSAGVITRDGSEKLIYFREIYVLTQSKVDTEVSYRKKHKRFDENKHWMTALSVLFLWCCQKVTLTRCSIFQKRNIYVTWQKLLCYSTETFVSQLRNMHYYKSKCTLPIKLFCLCRYKMHSIQSIAVGINECDILFNEMGGMKQHSIALKMTHSLRIASDCTVVEYFFFHSWAATIIK